MQAFRVLIRNFAAPLDIMEKLLTLLLLLVLMPGSASALDADTTLVETDSESRPEHGLLTTAKLETRFSWQRDWAGSRKQAEKSGFFGDFINVVLGGHIGRHWSYAYRQRLSKQTLSDGFFNATDWLYLTYKPNERWEFSAGKECLSIGGFAYDKAPIDVYHYSEYLSNISCYQIGVSAAYNLSPADRFVVQATQSPFRGNAADMYGFGLQWVGRHGCYNSLWSTQLFEATPGHWIHFLALGNRFDFGCGQFVVDWTNRYAGGWGASFFGDFTLSGELHVQPVRPLNLFVKYVWDHNSGDGSDFLVRPGTRLHHLQAGAEFYPLKGRRDVRFHASYARVWGTNGNLAGVWQGNESIVKLGLTFRFDFLNLKQQFKFGK